MSSATVRHPPATYAGAPSRPHPYSRSAQPSSHHRRSPPRDDRDFPPSPPRSHHDAASPPLQKASVDQSDNYWEDVPPAPASLKSILDSFRRSGEGDRDLLMAILQAKKSEEERLTAIIQTRLTILQARLNMAAIQAQMPGPVPADAYPPAYPPATARGPGPEPTSARQERTSSLSSSVSAATSPPNAPYYYSHGPERIHLPPPMGYADRERLPPMRERERERERDVRERRESDPRDRRDRPASPREPAGGLEMLLEGVREAERKERV
ncbi:hypothetical protein CC85DRAFT_288663 [Cutaneotrichosporon oleaginosum]|uniref:Uncharacterized protein n=1 Tax=Cutaneotrichosporon oleaginosum TaxID=879819 RepID=A0A0J1AVM7_9TREE|nr:uncharacterized protein CC85DRAFT_288663 [Cutaneotrichosporon oleaginosum]KLT39339.1 hypothetical protein CC85DRAFT_288663 [Cutaneotrichosporon oleaginosum]TXT08535.1 hypothetical protein COLE_05459 [Cutaneotrichosporon oleaginosum]